jgi:hypothetical protein
VKCSRRGLRRACFLYQLKEFLHPDHIEIMTEFPADFLEAPNLGKAVL